MLFVYFAMLQNPEDESLFETFYNKFYPKVYYIARKHLHTHHIAEECAQEVFMCLAKEFHNIPHDFDNIRLIGFINLVAKNRAIDMYRKEMKYIEAVDADITDIYDISVSEFDIYETVELKEAFEKIPEEYRYICYLKYGYQLTGEQISKVLNISQPLVRKRCMLGKRYMRDYLEGKDSE